MKIIKIIGLFGLFCLCFFYTEKVINVTLNQDEIMIKIIETTIKIPASKPRAKDMMFPRFIMSDNIIISFT